MFAYSVVVVFPRHTERVVKPSLSINRQNTRTSLGDGT